MAGEEDKKTIQTAFGTFTEIQPGVLADTRIDLSILKVPASVSRTGQEETLTLSPGTLLINGETTKKFIEADSAATAGTLEASALLNNLSRLSHHIGMNRKSYEPEQGFEKLQRAYELGEVLKKSNGRYGPLAFVSTEKSEGIIDVKNLDAQTIVRAASFTLDATLLNVPKAYAEAAKAFFLSHETEHISSDKKITLEEESQADSRSLTKNFNREFTQFIYDCRALSSLNIDYDKVSPSLEDDHATHIWREEIEAGLPLDKTEEQKIFAAPRAIHDILSDATSTEDFTKIQADPATRYVYLASLRKAGAFDDTPYANEFVDKYLAAAERVYKPERLEQAKAALAQDSLEELAYNAEPDISLDRDEVAEKLRDDPVYRYANLSAQLEMGAFNVYAGGSDWAARELTKLDTEHPGIAAQYDHEAYKERYDDIAEDILMPKQSEPAPASAPAAASPAPKP